MTGEVLDCFLLKLSIHTCAFSSWRVKNHLIPCKYAIIYPTFDLKRYLSISTCIYTLYTYILFVRFIILLKSIFKNDLIFNI